MGLVLIAALGGGLSPRVRGNHAHADGAQEDDRSIPACAGEPDSHGVQTRRVKVYPRVCGGTTWCWRIGIAG